MQEFQNRKYLLFLFAIIFIAPKEWLKIENRAKNVESSKCAEPGIILISIVFLFTTMFFLPFV